MSNTSDTKPYIKISDSFDVPIQMIDTRTDEAVEITSGMMFSSKIINLQGEVIATPSVVPYLDQIADKGYILLSVPTSVTSTWKAGKAKTDIKMSLGDSVRHSQDFCFYIIEAIT